MLWKEIQIWLCNVVLQDDYEKPTERDTVNVFLPRTFVSINLNIWFIATLHT